MPIAPEAGRAAVAAYYNARAEEYRRRWSQVLMPANRQLLDRLALAGAERVLDLGSGVGSVLPAIAERAPAAVVVAADRSIGMLRLAPAATRRAVVDAQALPFHSDSFDAVVLAFMIQHLPDPRVGFAEVRRVLRPGGRIGIALWGVVRDSPALTLWHDELDRRGVPVAAPMIDQAVAVNSPEAVADLLAQAGFRSVRVSPIPWSDQPDAEAYLARYQVIGAPARRFEQLPADGRSDFLDRMREQVIGLPAEAFLDSTEVFGAVASA